MRLNARNVRKELLCSLTSRLTDLLMLLLMLQLLQVLGCCWVGTKLVHIRCSCWGPVRELSWWFEMRKTTGKMHNHGLGNSSNVMLVCQY